MVLVALAYSLYKVIKLPAPSLRFAHDDLFRAGLHDVELKPLAPRC